MKQILYSGACALVVGCWSASAVAQTYGPYSFDSASWSTSAVVTGANGCAGGSAWPVGSCVANVVGHSPNVCIVNVNHVTAVNDNTIHGVCSTTEYVEWRFDNTPIVNVVGPDIIVFLTRFSTDGVAISVETEPDVFTPFEVWRAEEQLLLTGTSGCEGKALAAAPVDLSRFGLPTGFSTRRIRATSSNAGTGCEADITMAGVPSSLLCKTDAECNDGNPCTTDTCVSNACSYSVVLGEGCPNCVTDIDCSEPTSPFCVAGECTDCLDDYDCGAGSACKDWQCACVPALEVCDGLDNDCNGTADDGFAVGSTCSNGIGACASNGIIVCDGHGGAVCSTMPGSPTEEVCDGFDNDCDGVVDNGFTLGTACSNGIGACAVAGVIGCNGSGGVVCNAIPGAQSEELCDGVDNDCDGVVDNGLGLGEACSNGIGECAATGVLACNGSGGVICNAIPGAQSEEVCDGVDNDCDGVVDNGDPGAGADCQTGLSGNCASGLTRCVLGKIVCESKTDKDCEEAEIQTPEHVTTIKLAGGGYSCAAVGGSKSQSDSMLFGLPMLAAALLWVQRRRKFVQR